MSLARATQVYERFKPFTLYAYKGDARTSHYPRGYFKHRFRAGGGKVLGLPDGSILFKPRRRGGRLWGRYTVKHPLPKLPNTEPFLNPMPLVVVNPRGSRSRRTPAERGTRGLQSSGAIHRRGNYNAKRWNMAKKHHYRRARRNPLGLPSMGQVKDDTIDAVAIAGGLIGVPLVLSFVPLPAFAQAGMGRHVTKAVGAVLIGTAAGMLLGRRVGRLVGIGGLAGIAAELGSGLAMRALPGPAPGGVSSDSSVELTVLPGRGLGGYTGYGLRSYTGMPAYA